MPSIKARSTALADGSTNTTWRARYRDRRGVQHEKLFRRKVDARNWIDAATASIVRGDHVDPRAGMVTVGEWSGRWLAAQGNLKPSTRSSYQGVLTRYVLPSWAAVHLVDVQHAEVGAWVAGLTARGLAPSTVRHAHRVLAQVLGMAVRDGRLARNVAEKIALPRTQRSEPRFLTHADVDDLAGYCRPPYDTLVQVLAYTGLRFGEVAALRVRRVDLMRRRLQVAEAVAEVDGALVYGTPKTHQARSVPLPRFLVEPLTGILAGRGPDELVFLSEQGGPLRNTNFRHRVFDPARRAAGLEHVTPHDLRHTAASLAVSAGANVKAVQQMLGHASAAMTLDTYAGLFADDLDAVADRLDAGRAASARVRAEAAIVKLRP